MHSGRQFNALTPHSRVVANFVAFNEAEEGAGMYFGGAQDCENVAVVRGNIVYDNDASVAGGGVWGPRGRLENNTIYGNDAPDGAGIYSDWWPSSPCTDYVLQNLILWANSDGGSLGTQIEGSAASYIVYSAVDATTNPAGGGDSTNLGRWGSSSPILASGANGPDFLSTTFNTGSPNWSTFLHLDDSSPMIDRGQESILEYAAEVMSTIPTDPGFQYVFQLDFDGQISPIDIPSVGTEFNTGSDPDFIPMDIGADEYPTEVATFHYWWQAHE